MPVKKTVKEASILYIEDDAVTRKQLSKYFKSQCRVLHTAVDGEEGFELYQKYAPDIVITDIEMPKLNGLEMAKIRGCKTNCVTARLNMRSELLFKFDHKTI